MDWIKKDDFEKIEVGDTLTFRFMFGDNKVVKKPYKTDRNDCIKVNFTTGPWTVKNDIELIRQQVKSIK